MMHIIRSIPKSAEVDFWIGDDRFAVRGRPRRLNPGDTVFFSHRGKIMARTKLLGVRPVRDDDDLRYLEQGSPTDRTLYHDLRVGSIKPIRGGPSYVGRVGIRYIDNLPDRSLRKRLAALVL